jgi:hypothetical protein
MDSGQIANLTIRDGPAAKFHEVNHPRVFTPSGQEKPVEARDVFIDKDEFLARRDCHLIEVVGVLRVVLFHRPNAARETDDQERNQDPPPVADDGAHLIATPGMNTSTNATVIPKTNPYVMAFRRTWLTALSWNRTGRAVSRSGPRVALPGSRT